jgi:hypothetical protein
MIKKSILIFGVLLVISHHKHLQAQCCSSGSPVGASTNIGILDKSALRFITFYRHNYSDTYYEGTSKSNVQRPVKKMEFDYGGLTLSYGLTYKLTIEGDLGYFFNKSQLNEAISIPPYYIPEYTKKGTGFSNGNLTLKYCLYNKPARNVEVTGGLGLKYALTSKPIYDQLGPLPIDIQPSTHAFGMNAQVFLNKGFPDIGLRIFSFNKFEYNGQNADKYQYGLSMINSIFVSKKIVPYLFGIVQLRSEMKGKDFDHNELINAYLTNTGNRIIFVSPQISYSIMHQWHIAILTDIPVYKNYFGKQLTPGYSVAVSLSHDFAKCFCKK